MIRASWPGDAHVYGSHIFSLYDWGAGGHDFASGLIRPKLGVRQAGYYGFRMAVRALQGCRTTYQTAASERDVLAITTQDREGSED